MLLQILSKWRITSKRAGRFLATFKNEKGRLDCDRDGPVNLN